MKTLDRHCTRVGLDRKQCAVVTSGRKKEAIVEKIGLIKRIKYRITYLMIIFVSSGNYSI